MRVVRLTRLARRERGRRAQIVEMKRRGIGREQERLRREGMEDRRGVSSRSRWVERDQDFRNYLPGVGRGDFEQAVGAR
jgi:hypothetical protein